jgi:hypothetical protein
LRAQSRSAILAAVLFNSKLAIAIAVTAVIATPCRPCTFVHPSYPVGPDFRVKVEGQGYSLKGVRVRIASLKGGHQAFATTDNDGTAIFRGIRPGTYFLSAAIDEGGANGTYLEVSFNGPSGKTVPIDWLGNDPIRAGSLNGTIRETDIPPGQPQARFFIDLIDASRRTLRTTQMSELGEFRLGSAEAGLYFLRLRPTGSDGWSGERLIAVAIQPGAPDLDVEVGVGVCGALRYVDRRNCSADDLHVEQLIGKVVDASGAAIPNAKILLLDREKIVEQTESDSEGGFSSREPLSGTYQLVVRSAAFTSLRRTVHIATGASSRRSPLIVRLAIFGGCSAASNL